MEGQCKPVRGEKQGVTVEEGRKVWRKQVCRGGREAAQRLVLASKTTWEGGQTSEGSASHLWNHLQKLTDLSANPDMCRTAPETSVQICMPGWSRVPGEKTLSGKIPGSVLGKQRQTHNRDSQGGWMQGNHCFPGSVITHPAKGHAWGFLMGCLGEEGRCPFWREASMWPSKSCPQPGNGRFSLNLSLVKLKSQLHLYKETLF